LSNDGGDEPKWLKWFAERKEAMARSVFMVGEFGGNDYLHPLFQNKTLEWVRPLVPRVVRYIAGAVEELVGLGATTVYVPGLFPLGCVPRLLFLFRDGGAGDRDPATGCLRGLNDGLAALHNALLRRRLAELRAAHPGVTIAYADYYGEVMELVSNPAASGFDDALTACCAGGGPYNGNFTVHCSDPGATQCADPSRRISWDGLHMTEAVYRIMARGVLDGPFADPPIMSRCHGY
jgi:phospholipase/lecithinase/hemolysin